MSFSNTAENAILALIFNATAWANMADNAASTPQTNVAMALHTADPGEAGTQTTSEVAYTSYARVNVARTTLGFSAPSGGSTALAANCDFPTGTGGSGTVTHMSAGKTGGGATDIHMSGTVTPNITCGNGIIPRLTTATTFTLD
jgi:hypothetical protein